MARPYVCLTEVDNASESDWFLRLGLLVEVGRCYRPEMHALERSLGLVSIFARLRPDEVGRIAQRANLLELQIGQSHALAATLEAARLIIVIAGELEATLEDPTGIVHERMHPGDRYGEAMLLDGTPKAVRLTARSPCQIVLFDQAELNAVLAEFPAVALPLAEELSSELRARNEQVRQVLDLLASGLPPHVLELTTRQLRRSMVLRNVGMRRLPTRGIFRRLVVDRGDEPTFWMLVGFLSGLVGARVVVFFIVRYHLENELCALVSGVGPNPMHIHHFNYGLLMVAAVGLLALSPWSRRPLRTLAFLFGLGCGLTFDEFALFWHLKPDYNHGLSLITSAIAGAILIQLAYFRAFWLAMFERIAQKVRGE